MSHPLNEHGKTRQVYLYSKHEFKLLQSNKCIEIRVNLKHYINNEIKTKVQKHRIKVQSRDTEHQVDLSMISREESLRCI